MGTCLLEAGPGANQRYNKTPKLLDAYALGSSDGAERLFIADPTGKQGIASKVSVRTWIKEILEGADDRIFDEMKNEWSTDISPDADNEVVIELRKLGSFVSHSNYSLEDDDGLLAFLKKIYGANQLYTTRQL